MTQFRVRRSASMALVLALALTQTGRAQPQTSSSTFSWGSGTVTMPTSSTDSADRSYKIYSLDELGGDSSLGEWIAQTIPEVIAAGTWKGPGVIRYYAPKNILVVCHTSAVQAKVDGFLKDVKKSLPRDLKGTAAMGKSSITGSVVPAAYRAPALLKSSGPAPEPSLSYPVPAQPKAPKHLFHFIIRYEGEGLVDDNIVKAMKAYYQGEKKASEAAASGGACYPPVCVPATASRSSLMGAAIGSIPMTTVSPAGYATSSSGTPPLPSTLAPAATQTGNSKEKEYKTDKEKAEKP